MNICQEHWDRLRAAIDARGLSALVAETGEQAASNMVRQLQGEESIDTYDPLMAAYLAIGSNGMDTVGRVGGNPMVLLFEPPEGQEYPYPFKRCTICYLNWLMDEHDRICKEPDCQKPRGEAAHYEWMIDRAADDQVDHVREMNR